MHKRRRIRDAISDQLKKINGLNVIPARMHPVESLPSAVIADQQEEVEIYNTSKNLTGIVYTYKRTLDLNIELTVQANNFAEEKLDDLCEEVEVELARNTTLSGLVNRSELRNTAIEFDGETEILLAKATLGYQYIYYTNSNDPST